MNEHINSDGRFQSDKYPACPAGKVPLSTRDKTAQDLLWEYAQRRRAVDPEFSADLETCLRNDGFTQSKPTAISHCSVKVMRSHDYCHFEVVLGADSVSSTEQVDALRKEAARLADKAVAQYKIAKKNAEKIQSERTTRGYHIQRMERIQQTPEGERTVEEEAQLKAFRDEQWAASRSYDYEDDWSEDDWSEDDED